MITAIVSGTNTTKGQFQESKILLKGSSLDDHKTNVAGDFTSMSNLTRSFDMFTNNNCGAIGQVDVSYYYKTQSHLMSLESSVAACTVLIGGAVGQSR